MEVRVATNAMSGNETAVVRENGTTDILVAVGMSPTRELVIKVDLDNVYNEVALADESSRRLVESGGAG